MSINPRYRQLYQALAHDPLGLFSEPPEALDFWQRTLNRMMMPYDPAPRYITAVIRQPPPWSATGHPGELPFAASAAPLNPAPASLINQAAPDQPMPDHLNHADRIEIELLLLRIFPSDTHAIAFLAEHNHGLRAKPLDLITRDQDGVATLLTYLRQAADNAPPRL